MDKKKLVIEFEIPFDNENERDVIKYCHEIAAMHVGSPDFVKATINGEEIDLD